jgi:hypothetical protein
VPVSELAFDPQLFNGQRVIANFWSNDRLPGVVVIDADQGGPPQRGQTGDDYVKWSGTAAAAGPLRHRPRLAGSDHVAQLDWLPKTGQRRDGIRCNLIYYRGWHQGNSIDPNLLFDQQTGYYKAPGFFGRPNPKYGRVYTFVSDGKNDNLSLTTSFNRRYHNNLQAGVTYTLMFFRHDTGTSTAGAWGVIDNPFCISCEWATANDFQRHTQRVNAIYRLKYDITLAAASFAGSGNRFQTLAPTDPLGASLGANRLSGRLGADGVLLSGYVVVPRNAIQGDAIHKDGRPCQQGPEAWRRRPVERHCGSVQPVQSQKLRQLRRLVRYIELREAGSECGQHVLAAQRAAGVQAVLVRFSLLLRAHDGGLQVGICRKRVCRSASRLCNRSLHSGSGSPSWHLHECA